MTNFITNFQPLCRYFTVFATLFALLTTHNGYGAENVAQGVKVVVIDAGHGGTRYPGAQYNNIAEKDINLKMALLVGDLIKKNLPDIKVVYTRTTDMMFSSVLTDDLQARADIAHRNQGDLFISIHSNAHRNSEVRGVETLIMGETSMEQRVNQNALYVNNKEELLDMSDEKTATIVRAYIQNLQFTYGEYSEMLARLVQEEYVKLGMRTRGVRRQPLKVLYATDMPSILTEIGFMSNAEDLKYITSEKGQDQIAAAIFRAVKTYTENVHRSLLLDSAPVAEQRAAEAIKSEPKPTENRPTTNSENKHKSKATVKLYAIQLLASVKHIPTSHPELKSYRGKVWILETNSSLKYKYCYGEFADKAMAQKQIAEVRKEFPQAFIISFDKTK
jgi:N-acetylmuramoyl-L-alanine amidase